MKWQQCSSPNILTTGKIQSMKKLIFLNLSLFVLSWCQAQVVVNIQLPATGLTLKSQLWNLSLVNTGQEMNVQIEMTMTDASNSQRVLTAVSRIFKLQRGAKQVQVSDLLPIVYTPGSPGYNVDARPDGFLPIGIFHVCYGITVYINDRTEQLTEDCETIEIEPISPPQLVLPADNEHVDLTRPFFTWLPPTPFNLFNNLVYDWVLVEVQPMQSAADALQQNIPVLTQQNIAYASLQYPLSAPELDSSKLYAWRVTAKNNLSPIAVSEVWLFKVKQYGIDATTRKTAGSYSRLRRMEDASYIISNGIVRFEHLNELANSEATISIYDVSHPKRRELSLDSTNYALKYGQNFIEINLDENSKLTDRHVYLLELTNARNERWYLKFEYRADKRKD
jgi:hypothetical protein